MNVSNELTLVSNGYGVCLLNLPIFEQPKNLQSYLLSVIKFLAEHCMHDTTLELCSEFEWLMIDEEFRFDEDIQNAKKAGIDDFLAKPIESDKLKELLIKYNFSIL